jgi:hypothetical protein
VVKPPADSGRISGRISARISVEEKSQHAALSEACVMAHNNSTERIGAPSHLEVPDLKARRHVADTGLRAEHLCRAAIVIVKTIIKH